MKFTVEKNFENTFQFKFENETFLADLKSMIDMKTWNIEDSKEFVKEVINCLELKLEYLDQYVEIEDSY